MWKRHRDRRQRAILQTPWPAAWNDVIHANVDHVCALDEQHWELLRERTQLIVGLRRWEAVGGFTLTEEMQVTVAAQAALMLLGSDGYYFDNVPTIILYPEPFGRDFQSGGVKQQHQLAGEAWQGGPVILSWPNVLAGGRRAKDGANLVFHEFSHVLDGIDGEMGGNVIFADHQLELRWVEETEKAFSKLVSDLRHGRRTLLDPYAATNKAEFFAVSSETFFEQPEKFQQHYPVLFDLFLTYYRVDPRSWRRLEPGQEPIRS